MNKKEIEEFVKANKWFAYEQAENELRKHWNSDYDKDGDYLKIKRRQIQKILRSDIIGTYLEMDKREVGITEEEIFMKKLYGWTAEETFYLEYYDSERDDIIEEEYIEKLHVFPKYDRLFWIGYTRLDKKNKVCTIIKNTLEENHVKTSKKNLFNRI